MGTRSLTKVIETYKDTKGKSKKSNLLCMYKQYDGYPSYHGKELAKFLEDMIIVNGIGLADKRKIANGMGCLSAQLISHFKTEVGNIYIYPPDSQRDWEDYEYIIEGGSENEIKVKVNNFEDKTIFKGSVKEFNNFCDEV